MEMMWIYSAAALASSPSVL